MDISKNRNWENPRPKGKTIGKNLFNLQQEDFFYSMYNGELRFNGKISYYDEEKSRRFVVVIRGYEQQDRDFRSLGSIEYRSYRNYETAKDAEKAMEDIVKKYFNYKEL